MLGKMDRVIKPIVVLIRMVSHKIYLQNRLFMNFGVIYGNICGRKCQVVKCSNCYVTNLFLKSIKISK